MRFRWIGLLLAVLTLAGVGYFSRSGKQPLIVSTSSAPATQTTVVVVEKPTEPLPPPMTLFDVLKRDFAIPTTQPLGVPVSLTEAARLVIDRPIYLDEIGHTWVSHPDSETIDAHVAKFARGTPSKEPTHAVRETVRYVFWINAAGRYQPIVLIDDADGLSIVAVTAKGRLALPQHRRFHFARALSLLDSVAIPCDDGIAVLRFADSQISEQFLPLPPSKDPLTQPQVLRAAKGLLAWSPASPTRVGSTVSRYLNNTWSILDPKDWPTSIVQLTPFLDGTVQQLRQGEDGKIEITSVLLDSTPVDEKRVLDLIDQLSDGSEPVRNQAFKDLQRVGPSAWPIARKVFDDQLPETQQRLTVLLAAQLAPSLGSMTSIDGRLRVVARYPNAAILLYAYSGVSIARPGEDPAILAPAWICVRPDASPELLPDLIVEDLRPGSADLIPVGGDWILTDGISGPRRFGGNHLQNLLRKNELKFYLPVGVDRRGRWLFRQPGQPQPTLLIDPTIPDLTPRLPIWTLRVKNGSVGWSAEGWPAIKRGGAWEMRETAWRSMDETKNPLLTTPDSTAAESTATNKPLLTDRDGNQYFDGVTALRIVPAQGQSTTWPLPSIATGVQPVKLIEAADGKLFLFNQPGRVLRFAKTADPASPLKLDATFAKNVPNTDSPTRIWLDPAGRICFAWETNLAILFPTGTIPRQILEKMTAEEIQANEPD